MVPSPTRRQLLVSVAGLGGVGSVAAAPRTWYPDPVVDRMLGYRRLPETETRPPVPEGVLAEGLENLEEYLERADSLWDGVDDDRDELPDDARMGPTLLSEAHDRHGELRGATSDRDALRGLRRAHGNVGYAIGAGRLVRDETDEEGLVERGDEIRGEVADLRERIEYRFDDPASDVPTLYWIEDALVSASLNSHRGGTYTGGVEPADDYGRHDVPTTWEAHLQAEVGLLEATHTYREFEAERDDGRDGTEAVDSQSGAFAREVERTREDYDDREEMFDDISEGPYSHARFWLWDLANRGLDIHHDGGPWGGLDLLRTVVDARNVLKLRAYSDALERFELEEGVDPDPALAYRMERAGARRLRTLIDDHDTALFRLLVDDATRLLEAGHFGVTSQRDPEGRARARAEAYVYYLFADAQLRHAADVYAEIVGALE